MPPYRPHAGRSGVKLRSLLFVPGDSERKFARACSAGADVLILDLEDAVAPPAKAKARSIVQELLGDPAPRAWRFMVRINALDTGLALVDLAAVVKPGLDAIMVPKANSLADIVQFGHYLEALEVRAGMVPGAIGIAVVATETPAAMFALGSYAQGHPRLLGLTWGAEDLSAAIGASVNKEADGGWTSPYVMARAQCLFAASAAGVAPLDTLYADYRDHDGLAADSRRARRDGFVGRLAIHPDQIEVINASFTPSEEDVAHARRVAAAFDEAPDAGVVGIDGRMYDIPHLKAARRTLAAAGG